MKNYTNIYDIDGRLIRAAGDNHKFTLEEIEKLVDYYHEKHTQQPDNQVYTAYLNNLYKWMQKLYSEMPTDEVLARLNTLSETIKAAKANEVNIETVELTEAEKAIEDLAAQYENTTKNDDRDTQFDDIPTAEEVVPMAVQMDGEMPDD